MKTHTLQIRRAFLVYQAGTANVFDVDSFNLADSNRNAKRIFRGSFQGAIDFCQGLAAAGVGIKTAACNKDGDIRAQKWSDDVHKQPSRDNLLVFDVNNTGYSD